MNIESDRLLVERAKTDPAEFGKLFDLYYDQIFSYCLNRTGNYELSQDVVSDTFHKALKNLWKYKWMNLPFSAWLYRIATNEINSFYRKNKSFNPVELTDVTENNIIDRTANSDQNLDSKEANAHLNLCLNKLGKKYQEVLSLRYFEEKSIKEVAEILNKPEGTVKSLISRGLDKLKKEINPSFFNEVGNE